MKIKGLSCAAFFAAALALSGCASSEKKSAYVQNPELPAAKGENPFVSGNGAGAEGTAVFQSQFGQISFSADGSMTTGSVAKSALADEDGFYADADITPTERCSYSWDRSTNTLYYKTTSIFSDGKEYNREGVYALYAEKNADMISYLTEDGMSQEYIDAEKEASQIESDIFLEQIFDQIVETKYEFRDDGETLVLSNEFPNYFSQIRFNSEEELPFDLRYEDSILSIVDKALTNSQERKDSFFYYNALVNMDSSRSKESCAVYKVGVNHEGIESLEKTGELSFSKKISFREPKPEEEAYLPTDQDVRFACISLTIESAPEVLSAIVGKTLTYDQPRTKFETTFSRKH